MAFKDNYTASRYMVPVKEPMSVRIDGTDLLSYGFVLAAYPSSLLFPTIEHRHDPTVWRQGSRNFGSRYANWNFTLEGFINGLTREDLINKLDKFKQHLDHLQHKQFQYLLRAYNVRGLMFEIGEKYWYTAGTISGSNGATVITGSGTEWSRYLKGGAELEISGQTTKYTVLNVASDTEIELTPALSAEVSGGTSYRAERRRFLSVNLDEAHSIFAISNRGMLSQTGIDTTYSTKSSNVMNVSIGLVTTYPFWVGHPVTHKETSVSDKSFIEVKGIGTSPVNPIYNIVGSTDSVKISAAEAAFACHFDARTSAVLVDGTQKDATVTEVPGGGSLTPTYKAVKNGYGINAADNVRITYTGIPGNPNKFGFLARIIPQFNSDTSDTDDHFLFDFYDDNTAANAFQVYYDVSQDEWVLVVRSGGASDINIRTELAQNFDSGNFIELSGWYDADGRVDDKDGTTYYGKILVNGEVAGTYSSSITAPAANLDELIVGSQKGSLQDETFIESIISELVLFVYAPTDEELRAYYTQATPIFTKNVAVNTTNTLAADDMLTIDTHTGEVELYDASAGTTAVSYGTIDGNSPSLIPKDPYGDQSQILYVTAGSTVTELHTTFRPHYR